MAQLSCQSNSNKDGKVMKYVHNTASIPLQNANEPVKLSLIENEYTDFYANIDSIKIIPLETTDKSLIGNISRIFVIRDTLFIVDYYKTKSIFAFDMKGRYLYKINKTGNGPGEYLSINMVHIDHSTIQIIDWLSWKWIKYDLSGNLQAEKKIEPNPSDFIEIDDRTMLFAYNRYSPQTPYQVVFSDNNLLAKETAFPFINTRDLTSDSFSEFQKLENGEILYHYHMCNSIFQIKGNEITPKYDLALNNISDVESFYERTKNLNMREFVKEKETSDLVRHYTFLELKDVLYIDYIKHTKAYTVIVSKKNYQTYTSIAVDIKKRSMYILFPIAGYYDNALLSSIDESFFTFSKENQKLFYSHLKEIEDIQRIKKLENSEDNPLICISYINPNI
jgi:hypothetical protein